MEGLRRHKLLTQKDRAALRPLGATENEPDPVCGLKFFSPCSQWRWYVLEGEACEDDVRFFGYVDGFEGELGYFMLSELAETKVPRLPFDVPAVERDCHWHPKRLSEIRA